ncbi:hypothetical protein SAMN05428944_7900 [Streptomyces sp. 1222.5]|nr:hypothetical protein BX260_7906 [Streptomyces sp. 5112.2]SED50192.1 hypothetical protein SAMN05428944_7900 [Streptomyces sp. 1222.5]
MTRPDSRIPPREAQTTGAADHRGRRPPGAQTTGGADHRGRRPPGAQTAEKARRQHPHSRTTQENHAAGTRPPRARARGSLNGRRDGSTAARQAAGPTSPPPAHRERPRPAPPTGPTPAAGRGRSDRSPGPGPGPATCRLASRHRQQAQRAPGVRGPTRRAGSTTACQEHAVTPPGRTTRTAKAATAQPQAPKHTLTGRRHRAYRESSHPEQPGTRKARGATARRTHGDQTSRTTRPQTKPESAKARAPPDCRLRRTAGSAGLQAPPDCRLRGTAGCAGLQAVRDCRLCGTAGCAGLQAVRDCRLCGTAGCAGLRAVRDCRLCGTAGCAGLQAVRDCGLCGTVGCEGRSARQVRGTRQPGTGEAPQPAANARQPDPYGDTRAGRQSGSLKPTDTGEHTERQERAGSPRRAGTPQPAAEHHGDPTARTGPQRPRPGPDQGCRSAPSRDIEAAQRGGQVPDDGALKR